MTQHKTFAEDFMRTSVNVRHKGRSGQMFQTYQPQYPTKLQDTPPGNPKPKKKNLSKERKDNFVPLSPMDALHHFEDIFTSVPVSDRPKMMEEFGRRVGYTILPLRGLTPKSAPDDRTVSLTSSLLATWRGSEQYAALGKAKRAGLEKTNLKEFLRLAHESFRVRVEAYQKENMPTKTVEELVVEYCAKHGISTKTEEIPEEDPECE